MNYRILRTMKAAAFALALTLAMSGVALAHDDDDYYRHGNPDQARQYGYQNGYHDGVRQGRHEGKEHDPFDFHTPDWRRATRGYKGWMGPVGWYQRGYQDGYSDGFRSGYQSVAGGWGDGDRDDRRPEFGWRGGYGPDWGADGNIGYRFGYQDGSFVAREDIAKGKPFNPNPRGRLDDRDHGYRKEYGSKDWYRAQYTKGYREGYDDVMRHRY